MGGQGSGLYHDRVGKIKTWALFSLDIRFLNKKGVITSNCKATLTWGKNQKSGLEIEVFQEYLVFSYIYKQADTVNQFIYFTYTPCNYGGKRPWFVCPTCGRRCAILYVKRKYFECRKCCELVYQVQSETYLDRLTRKTRKLRKRIASEDTMPHGKPKWMHTKTWHEAQKKIDRMEFIGDMMFYYSLLKGKFYPSQNEITS